MYRKFYGLKKKPFELTPSGELVYLSEAHKEGIATLRYGVLSEKMFLLMTGGVGCGKTTLLNRLIALLPDNVVVCMITNPALTKHEFYHYLCSKLGLVYKKNKGEFLVNFSALLDDFASRGKKVLLIIDEVQAFSIQMLEEIRLLSNAAGENKVLSIFLVGQPEFKEKLFDPVLLPLRQRIGLRYSLEPFSEVETRQYISFRLKWAGAANPSLFSDEAVERIHTLSQGNPRLVNILCDHALIAGFSNDHQRITKKTIKDAVSMMHLEDDESLPVSEMADRLKKQEFIARGWIVLGSTVLVLLTLIVSVGFITYYPPLQHWLKKSLNL